MTLCLLFLKRSSAQAQTIEFQSMTDVFLKDSNHWLFLLMLYRQFQNRTVGTSKSNLHYSRGITPENVTSAGAHLRNLAPGPHCFEKTWPRWRAVGDAVSNLNGPRIEPMTSRADSNVFNQYSNRLLLP